RIRTDLIGRYDALRISVNCAHGISLVIGDEYQFSVVADNHAMRALVCRYGSHHLLLASIDYRNSVVGVDLGSLIGYIDLAAIGRSKKLNRAASHLDRVRHL